MIRLLSLLLSLLLSVGMATSAVAAEGPPASAFREFNVELPTDLRKVAGRGKVSSVAHALVTIALPEKFDKDRDWPVLVVSAPSDPRFNSSRKMLRAYAETGLGSGWILVAADAAEAMTAEQDDVPMRLALNTAALAVLERQWPGSPKAPLAFGGFSGGAKYSGWLAAAFASQGRTVIGVYQAGINEDTLADAAMWFNVLNAAFKRTPVFIQAGAKDEVATPAEHQKVISDLKRAGFRNVRIEFSPAAHDVDPGPLRDALDWFREVASLPGVRPRD